MEISLPDGLEDAIGKNPVEAQAGTRERKAPAGPQPDMFTKPQVSMKSIMSIKSIGSIQSIMSVESINPILPMLPMTTSPKGPTP